MRILFIGDIFGDTGRRVLADHLPSIKEEYSVDVTIANAENCAGGRGVTINYAKKLRKYGVNMITGGNHSYAQLEPFQDAKWSEIVLRPHNISNFKYGKGIGYHILPDGKLLAIINLMGKTFINGKMKCPFKVADELIKEAAKETSFIFVDFHAEATSEKVCLAHYLDGRVSAIVGTHTHVQTNDGRIFPKGTAFMTDAGMTGPEFSAIGMEHLPIIDKILNNNTNRFVQAKEGPMFNGVIIDLNESGKATFIEPVLRRYSFE